MLYHHASLVLTLLLLFRLPAPLSIFSTLLSKIGRNLQHSAQKISLYLQTDYCDKKCTATLFQWIKYPQWCW